MKIGLIQTQRLGDLIIVLPIAQYFAARGHRVYWPINASYLDSFRQAAPDIEFLPIAPELHDADPIAYFYHEPLRLLTELGCDRTFPLYVHLDGLIDRKLLGSLKFDEYKYALTGVPFAQKWHLAIRRNAERELALHNSLGITGPYICVHNEGSNLTLDLQLPDEWRQTYQIVNIGPLTDNPFDWLHTIEHAAKRVMIDSAYANLTDQMNIAGDKYLVLRSLIEATPVYRNGWRFCWPFDPIIDAVDNL